MIIKDCIYRFIEVPPLLECFIDTPEFQRLRRIKQLGLANYVYPSAVHTRFEHSLGVAHLAGVVVRHLQKVSKEVITHREEKLVMLAGLLHDIGHGPLSHTTDELCSKRTDEIVLHEQRSVSILGKINQGLGILTPQEEKMVADMILGVCGDTKRAYLFEIVNNMANGIDVDKMDYLARDAYHCGLPSFQPDYIIHGMVIQEGHIAFKKKVESDIHDMLLTRQRMFKLVYYHKTVVRIERIYLCMLLRAGDFPLSDDYELETFLRRKFPSEMHQQIDLRRLDHDCEVCRGIQLDKVPRMNGKLAGDREVIIYV